MSIVLCGYQNCGKTTVGRLLAEMCDWEFIDTDDLIRAAIPENKDVWAIYQAQGEKAFRGLEYSALQSIIPAEKQLIATGGGTLASQKSLETLKQCGKLIYLKCEPAVLFSRMLAQKEWPAFIDAENPEESFYAHYDTRATLYERECDIEIDVSHKTLQDIGLTLKETL